MKKILFIAMVATLIAACGNNSPVQKTHPVRALTLSNQEKTISQKQNQYALDLLKVMAQKEDNVFVSPLSAAFVCTMVANGANGQTQDEILEAIGCKGYTIEELNAHYLNLMENLPYQDATTYIALANAIWVNDGFPVSTDYADAVRTHYLAEVSNLNLSNPSSANVLNKWAMDNTDGMITKICDESQFTPQLCLVLANALCFKGKWNEEFDKSKTSRQTFHSPAGDVSVDMMHAYEIGCATSSMAFYTDSEGKYHEEEQGARILTLDYKDKGYCMDIIVPEPEKTLDELMPMISIGWLDTLKNHNAGYSAVDVSMPKWKMQARYRLNDYMAALGMKQVFTPNADLTKISSAADLYLSLLQQDTYIEVDEEGTKAAAVTIGMMEATSAAPSDPIVIDRPFIFLIRDMKNGIILFAGRINNPATLQ